MEIKKSFKEYSLSFLIIILIFTFDQVSKKIIINNQVENNVIFINDFINFNLTWNTGIGFGLLSFSSGLIYNMISLIIFLVVCYLLYLLFLSTKFERIFYSFIIEVP